MNLVWTYPVELRREEDGTIGAYASAMPAAVASGASEEDALREMGLALDAAVRGTIQFGFDLAPPPEWGSFEEIERITISPELAAKASAYVLWKASDLTKVALAEKVGLDEKEVRRVLSAGHGTSLGRVAQIVQALGHSLTIGIAPLARPNRP